MRQQQCISGSETNSSPSTGTEGFSVPGSSGSPNESISTSPSKACGGAGGADDEDRACQGSPEAGIIAKTSTNRQPLSRRGHFKSRLGCFNCKRRRVKCNEVRPTCSPCQRLGLSCAYPSTIASPPTIRAAPSILSMEDLKFYHHFLTIAFPSLPLDGAEAWMNSAAMSYQYDYLAHALLGLGASHLTQNTNLDFNSQALQHRIIAIKLVNEQLDNPPKKTEDCDALMATVLCLVSQAALMPDSMIEYLTMTRGANLVAMTVVPDMLKSVFSTFTPEGHTNAIARLVVDQPKDYVLIEGFRSSVRSMKLICRESFEIRYVDSMIDTIQALHISGFEAWLNFVVVFRMPANFTNDEFLTLCNSHNHLGHLIIVHAFLLDYLLGQFCMPPELKPKTMGRKNTIISWSRATIASVPGSFQRYTIWPEEFCNWLEHSEGRYLLSP